jgi:hypothetical protein
MEGRTSNPADWPLPFRVDEDDQETEIGLIDLGGDHYVRADITVSAEGLIS